LGWINWGINTFPLLKPGLHSSYVKIQGKSNAHASIFLNKQVLGDLRWVAETMESATGLLLYDATEWSHLEADMVIFCDASLLGLGFYCPSLNIAYYVDIMDFTPTCTIFFYETLCILSALTWVHNSIYSPRQLLIYKDSMNTVEIFNSLKAEQGYNELLMHAVGLLIPSGISLCVFHIAGSENTVADALSRGLLDVAQCLHPRLVLQLFWPPPCVSGADVL